MRPDTLYIDPDRRFAVALFQNAKPGHVICDDWDDIDRNMTLRMVTTLEELDEKIAILDDGLDDVAVERMRFFLCNVIEPKLKDKHSSMRYAGRSHLPEYVDEAVTGHIRFSVPTDDKGVMMQINLPMPIYYEQLLASQLDVRFSLPEGLVAPNVSAEWMRCGMLYDPGLNMTYFREYDVENSDFYITAVTIRKTAANPTMRLHGLYEHKRQITYFPPVFSDIDPIDSTTFLCMYNGSPMVINEFGGLFDVFLRHLPPRPVVNMNDYLAKLDKWVFQGSSWYYRDTTVPLPPDHPYAVGHIFRAGTFIDTTTSLHKPADGVRTRFAILSAHAIPMSQIKGISENSPETALWDLHMFHYNDLFRVVDVTAIGQVTQVTLIQVPYSAQFLIPIDPHWDFLEKSFQKRKIFSHLTLREYALRDFTIAMDGDTVSPLSFNAQWVERTRALVGLDQSGHFFDIMPVSSTDPGVSEFENTVFSRYTRRPDIKPVFSLEARKADTSRFLD